MRRLSSVFALVVVMAGCASSSGGGGRSAGAVKPYPLGTCLVTGTRLGSMGDPYVKVFGDQEIKFCCEPCVDEFEEDPAKFLELLQK